MPNGQEPAVASALPVDEAREIRASLTAIMHAAWEAKATLEKYGCG